MKNCTYVIRTVLCICLFVAWIVPGFSQQIEKGIRVSNGEYLGFLEYKPVDYSTKTGTKFPLIIFLHGIGERGNGTTDLKNVACCGLPRIIKRGHNMTFTWNGKTETFIVLSPQCPKSYGMWPNLFIEELINYAKNNLRIDPDRIYLTGLSMGGGGTFKYISTAAEQPKNLAAAATICAPCTFKEGKYVADAKLPFWAFHAADDAIALASCTESAVRRVNEQNPVVKPLKTIWPTGGHIVWDRVYTDTNYRYNGVVNIYEWFLGQKRTLAPNKLPVANAGSTINITTTSGIATLNGSASSDADGRIVRYVWKKLEGPAVGIITNPFSANSSTTVTGLTMPGTYKYELSVVDDRASYTSDIVTVVVSSASSDNKLPIANAGQDIIITLPVNTAKLDGTGSSDPDGSIASYTWSKVSGPATTLLTPNNSVITLNMLSAGTYVFKLKVTDNKGASSEDQVTVTVNPAPPNAAPAAHAGIDFSITLPQNTATLDASKSSDPDGKITSYLWSKISGPAGGTIANPTAISTQVSGLQEGTYVYKLKVTDNGGSIGDDLVTITVKAAPNTAPVANAGADISITLPVNKVTLNGSASKDADGTLQTYSWSKISGPASFKLVNALGVTTEANSLVEGTYEFKLKVTDDRGASSEDIVMVKVNPAPNSKPVARAGSDLTITLPTNRTVLNGTASSDADGTIIDYAWSKISGPATFNLDDATAASTEVSNLSEGLYKFRLQVTDDKGAKSADTMSITVLAAPPPPNVAPVAQAGQNISIQLPENSVTLNGASSSDEDGTIVDYSWSFVNGPESFVITDASSANTQVTGLIEGTYYFRLEVTDDDGASNADTVSVVVEKEDLPPPPPNKVPVAIAGEDLTITLPTSQVTLDGSTSVDEDGTLVNYSWLKLTGPNQFRIVSPSYHETIVENLVEGTYTFRLQVKDNDGALGYDTIKVTVKPAPNKLPIAKAGLDMSLQLPQNEIELNGADSYDPDGEVNTYKWEYVSGPAVPVLSGNNTATTGVIVPLEGVYTFRLTITDDKGATSSDVVKVTVLPEPLNEVPVAIAGNDINVQLPNPVIKLDGSNSYDPDGTIASFSWVKVDGPGGVTITASTTSAPSIVGVTEGEYLFELTVTDDKGSTAKDIVKVTVAAAPPVPNQAPVAYAGEDKEIAYPASQSELTADHSSDNDGEVVSYEWKLVSGPSQVNITAPAEKTTVVTQLIPGDYVFEVIVRDNDGAEDRDTVRINVIDVRRFEEVMTVYPNPAVSSLNVQLTTDTMGTATITIYNSMGAIMKSIKKDKTQAQLFENLNVSEMQTGLYYVEVMIGGKLRRIHKFIKRQ